MLQQYVAYHHGDSKSPSSRVWPWHSKPHCHVDNPSRKQISCPRSRRHWIAQLGDIGARFDNVSHMGRMPLSIVAHNELDEGVA